MIGNSVLLDTSIVIELFKGNPAVSQSLKAYQTINISFAVLGELYVGVYRSSNQKKHLKEINDFLANCNVLAADEITANIYATIKSLLLSKGKPIPENDIWIAATAKQYQIALITKDKHFNEIEDLIIEDWC